ncbi:hypothetical protein F2Q69_00047863 [Brassica cretica]|uniref:Uncharacterized protein n=1 Tax=Brassica cretica TaxID=69181 RepID=A0A8S9Q215_BRACR|nr:hypothetical protein F2Q69_00047863 [Brassica cretica]
MAGSESYQSPPLLCDTPSMPLSSVMPSPVKKVSHLAREEINEGLGRQRQEIESDSNVSASPEKALETASEKKPSPKGAPETVDEGGWWSKAEKMPLGPVNDHIFHLE